MILALLLTIAGIAVVAAVLFVIVARVFRPW